MKLDGPVTFGVWGRIKPGKTAEFRAWVAKDLKISELTAHQFFGNQKPPKLVQFHSGYGWLEVPALLDNIPEFIEEESVAVSVTDIYPSENSAYCEIHKIYYGRGDCPVCTGDIIHRGRRTHPLSPI